MKRYTIIKVIEQRYEVEANNKAEALAACSVDGDPYSVEILKETVKLCKEEY